jgi:EAL domain-containing protein (putative c-di-GMP-specific phosphodiesterase class I)
VLFEQVASSKQWDRLRRLGAQHGTGSALQAALTPLELAAWAGGRVVRPL